MPITGTLLAARVEALGLAGLADRIDDVRLLEDRGVLAAARHRSLAALADWSCRLLTAAGPSAPTWTGSAPRPAAAAAPTSPA